MNWFVFYHLTRAHTRVISFTRNLLGFQCKSMSRTWCCSIVDQMENSEHWECNTFCWQRDTSTWLSHRGQWTCLCSSYHWSCHQHCRGEKKVVFYHKGIAKLEEIQVGWNPRRFDLSYKKSVPWNQIQKQEISKYEPEPPNPLQTIHLRFYCTLHL